MYTTKPSQRLLVNEGTTSKRFFGWGNLSITQRFDAMLNTSSPKLTAFLFLAIIFLSSDMAAWAGDYAESICEEEADDFKRLAYWVIIAGAVTTPIGIGVVILPFGGFLWIAAELWWALC